MPLYIQHSNIWSLIGGAIFGGLKVSTFSWRKYATGEWILKLYSLGLLSIYFLHFILVIKDVITQLPATAVMLATYYTSHHDGLLTCLHAQALNKLLFFLLP